MMSSLGPDSLLGQTPLWVAALQPDVGGVGRGRGQFRRTLSAQTRPLGITPAQPSSAASPQGTNPDVLRKPLGPYTPVSFLG